MHCFSPGFADALSANAGFCGAPLALANTGVWLPSVGFTCGGSCENNGCLATGGAPVALAGSGYRSGRVDIGGNGGGNNGCFPIGRAPLPLTTAAGGGRAPLAGFACGIVKNGCVPGVNNGAGVAAIFVNFSKPSGVRMPLSPLLSLFF